jgi:hypothetical protein
MRIESLCAMELEYTDGFHLVQPYGNESGEGWGIGTGTVTGERLAGNVQWSNQPRRRGDGTMLPNVRGVITTAEHAEVFFDLSGRTVFIDRAGTEVGSQLLMTLFESEDVRYAWLNDAVCMTEGVIDPVRGSSQFQVHLCMNDLLGNPSGRPANSGSAAGPQP